MATDSEQQNPYLCGDCQVWDKWSGDEEIGNPCQYSVSYDHLAENGVRCLICRFVIAAIQVWENGNRQSLEKSGLGVDILGPFYFDVGLPTPELLRQRYHVCKTSQEIFSRIWVQIDVKRVENDVLVERDNAPRLSQLGRRSKPPLFTTTPQLVAVYSRVNETSWRLSGTSEGEVPFFNLGTLRNWIHRCEENHGERCVGKYHLPEDMPLGFRVIDTGSMSIMEPVKPVSFVALSYMWVGGGPESKDIQLEMKTRDMLETSGSLATVPIPKVILDTILLCRDLGENYVWVDRLCIIQDDNVTKPAQIAAMDQIYRSATFTIVAALNNRNGLGLPGYGGQPRQAMSSASRPPRRPEVEGRGIEPNGVASVVQSSLWNSRGWTFQERVLSKRRLFITEYQVIFECSVVTAEEELTWNLGQGNAAEITKLLPGLEGLQCPEGSSTIFIQTGSVDNNQAACFLGSVERSTHSIDVSFYVGDAPQLGDYCNWVEDYSARQLSFGSDIINAFTGVGNVLSRALGTRLVFGLPEKYLPQTLMWSCAGTMERKGDVPHIPSWSWASSLKPVDFHWLHGRSRSLDNTELLEITSLVEFFFQDPDQGLRGLEVEQRWEEHSMSIAEIASMAELPPTVRQQKRRPGDWRSNLIWQECPHNPRTATCHLDLSSEARYIAALFPGSIVFNTTVASLRIEDVELKGGRGANGDDFFCPSICTENGERVGVLNQASREWVQPRGSGDGNKRLFDFAVICGGLEAYSIRKWLAFMHEWDKMWQLHVIMVERLPCKPFVARRVEVGQVWTHMWKKCNPRWETVVLC